MKTKVPNNFVNIERACCPVCGKVHTDSKDTGILIHKGLREIPDEKTVTGYALCKEHQEQVDDGFIHLVEVDESKSTLRENGNLNPEDAYRTGKLCAIKKEVALQIFDTKKLPEMVFVDGEVIDKIQSMIRPDLEDDTE